jgi:hypothetical protein
MNPQTFQATINTVGVSFTMIGALLIAVDVTRQYKGHPYQPIVQSDPDSDDTDDVGIILQPPKTPGYLEWERINKRLMLAGLILIFVGGILQIWASWIK